MRVDRLVVPLEKSFCSSNRVRLPAREHSRAMATPLMPPPITATSNRRPSSEGRWMSSALFMISLDGIRSCCALALLQIYYCRMKFPNRLDEGAAAFMAEILKSQTDDACWNGRRQFSAWQSVTQCEAMSRELRLNAPACGAILAIH